MISQLRRGTALVGKIAAKTDRTVKPSPLPQLAVEPASWYGSGLPLTKILNDDE